MSDLTAYEQHEIASGRAVELSQVLIHLQQTMPFVTRLSVFPAHVEIVDGQKVPINAYVRFSFDNDRHLNISFAGDMPRIVSREGVADLRDLLQKEYDAQKAGERPFAVPPA